MIDRYARDAMKAVWTDENKFQTWLQVELAVCRAWTAAGAIPAEDMAKLENAQFDMGRWEKAFKRTRHDVTAFLDSVAASVGEESRFIHLGLTSNDVWDTATALQLRQATEILLADVIALEEAITRRTLEHKDTLMIGRTHGVHAEPTTLGLKLALWVEETRRMRDRLQIALGTVSVGKFSGAVGTHATLPPSVEEAACRELGLAVENVSSQIIPRDRHAEYVTTLAVVAASLEKFATEIRALQRTEVLEVEEPFHEGQTGSSAMPHKRNPELSERICGLARVIRGNSVAALENVALWHERDISHSSAERVTLPDSTITLDYILDLAAQVIGGMVVYPDNMRANLERTRGLVFSQRVLIALIGTGMSRQDAYEIVQATAMTAWHEGHDFRDLLRANSAVTERLPAGQELDTLFDYTYYTRHVDETFKRVGLISSEGCLCGCGGTQIGPVGFVQTHDGDVDGWIYAELRANEIIGEFGTALAAIAREINGPRLAEWALRHKERFQNYYLNSRPRREWKDR